MASTMFSGLTRKIVLALLILVSGSMAATAADASAQTVKVVMQSGLRILDPVVSSAYMTRDHGYMIYDTLLGMDSDFNIRPQMADWKVSDDGKTYTFTLRDGLEWHDGKPVRPADCIASIKRWAEKDSTGQMLMPMVAGFKVVDDKTFRIELNRPTKLLLEGLAKISSRPAFMMPARIAETPASTPITEYVGSGPFKFVKSEFVPGVKVVYEKNENYVPRREPPSWTAGGKVVNVDRVEWIAMPDPMTSVNALLQGEIDYLQQIPFDLLPIVAHKDGIKVETLDDLGVWTYYRFNHLYPPFDNKLIRQAAMYAVGQKAVLSALVGNPDYYRTCAAVFGCGMPYENDYGREMIIPSDIGKARQLLEQAHYDGTPVVILQPTDVALLAPQPIVIGAALRKAGFNVDMKPMDWQTAATQQNNQNPPSEGGWNILSTYSILAATGTPLNAAVAANGRKAWAGWPDVPAIETLRLEYAQSDSDEQRKSIVAKIQKLVIDEGVVVPLGQFKIPSAYSVKLDGVLHAPVTVFWNLKKK